MIAAAPAWAEWLALSLGALACAIWGAVVVLALRLARRYGPMLLPLLTMFLPPSDPLTGEELAVAIDADVGEPDCGVEHEHDSQCFPLLRR